MKKKLTILFLILAVLSATTACGRKQESGSEEPQEEAERQVQAPAEGKENSNKDEASEEKETVYSIGDTWEVDGQWKLTVNAINETEDRNQFSEKEPAQVFVIDFVYENTGYEDEDGFMDGLFFDLADEQIIDSEGFTGYSYPGDIVDYPQEIPVGVKCKAQSCIAVDNKSPEIKILISKYDGSEKEQEAVFVLEAE